MITVYSRTRRSLNRGSKVFWFVVAVFSLSFCLLAQMSLTIFAFSHQHQDNRTEEMSVFIDSSLSQKAKEQLIEKISAAVEGSVVKPVEATEVLQEEIIKLVGNKGNIPSILSVQYPPTRKLEQIEASIKTLQALKGVEAVSTNLEWIQKRINLRKALALGIFAFCIPMIVLVGLLFIQGVIRLNSFMKHEQQLLMMLGGSSWPVRGPLIVASFIAAFLSCLFGGILYAITIHISIPLLEDAFEVHLMPFWYVNILGYLLLTAVVCLFVVFWAFIIGGRTKPLDF